jgi:hypothetical protein
MQVHQVGSYSDEASFYIAHAQRYYKWNNANRLSSFGNVFVEIQPIKKRFQSNISADDARFLNKKLYAYFLRKVR